MKISIFLSILLLYFIPLSAQYEDSVVIELLYKGDNVTSNHEVLIDRATIYKYGEVILASAPISELSGFQYEISDSFGELGRRGNFVFDEEPLIEHNGKIPAKVNFEGKEYPAFIKVEFPKEFRFSLYTDTIKPVLNFWINVEMKAKDGNYYPMSPEDLILTTSYGKIEGLELILPPEPEVKQVTLTACLISDQRKCITATLPIMQKDANGIYEDEEGYNTGKKPEEDIQPRKKRKKDYLKVSDDDFEIESKDEIKEEILADEDSEDLGLEDGETEGTEYDESYSRGGLLTRFVRKLFRK